MHSRTRPESGGGSQKAVTPEVSTAKDTSVTTEREMTNNRPTPDPVSLKAKRIDGEVGHGSVLIAAITSCTNTSNPAVMVGAGLLARNAVERGLKPPGWVKTSLSPGSRVVADYLAKSGLQKSLDALGYNLAGFGCMT